MNHRLVLPKRGIEALAGRPVDASLFGRHANIIYFFFPSTLILWEGDHVNLFTVFGRDAARSTVQTMMLLPRRHVGTRSEDHWARNYDMFWQALDEDFALAASIQSTLASGANRELRLGASEHLVDRFHRDVERLLAIT